MIDLHRILVPTDFSKHSENALAYAAAFGGRSAAGLYFLRVVQDLPLFVPEAVAVAPPAVPAVEQLTAAVREALDRTIDSHQLRRFTVHAEVREGSPFYEVVRFAK